MRIQTFLGGFSSREPRLVDEHDKWTGIPSLYTCNSPMRALESRKAKDSTGTEFENRPKQNLELNF